MPALDDATEDLSAAFAPDRSTEVVIHVDEANAHGCYCNLALVAATETEFSLDFAFHHHDEPSAQLHARILLSPRLAERLAHSLAVQLAEYERRYGAIG